MLHQGLYFKIIYICKNTEGGKCEFPYLEVLCIYGNYFQLWPGGFALQIFLFLLPPSGVDPQPPA